jgi:hypothetical protein
MPANVKKKKNKEAMTGGDGFDSVHL